MEAMLIVNYSGCVQKKNECVKVQRGRKKTFPVVWIPHLSHQPAELSTAQQTLFRLI